MTEIIVSRTDNGYSIKYQDEWDDGSIRQRFRVYEIKDSEEYGIGSYASKEELEAFERMMMDIFEIMGLMQSYNYSNYMLKTEVVKNKDEEEN